MLSVVYLHAHIIVVLCTYTIHMPYGSVQVHPHYKLLHTCNIHVTLYLIDVLDTVRVSVNQIQMSSHTYGTIVHRPSFSVLQ